MTAKATSSRVSIRKDVAFFNLLFSAVQPVQIPNQVHTGEQKKEICKHAENADIDEKRCAEVEQAASAPHEGICQIGTVVHATFSDVS